MTELPSGPPASAQLRIATLNVNGIRAAVRRGFSDWLSTRQPDVIALQELRCPETEVPEFAGYQANSFLGDIPGRNGVGILSKAPAVAVRRGTGSREFDHEGRYIEVDLDLGHQRPGLTVGSLYLPKGGTPYGDDDSLAKYERKLRFCRHFRRYLTAARRKAQQGGREFLVMGDWNIAPTELDLRAWRTNRRSEGFLPAEREWISSVTSPRTLVDVVRRLHPDTEGPYSWWSWRGQAFTNDAGWRIDYQLATPALAATAIQGTTDREATYDERLSDHSPVIVDYEL